MVRMDREQSKEEEAKKRMRESATRLVAASLGVGLLSCLLYALQAKGFANVVSVLGTAVAVSAAALLTGGLVGFIFGIPRALQQDIIKAASEEEAADNTDKGERAAKATQVPPHARVSYGANTNFEQISDWLTKILVGVGLTQIAKAPGALRGCANYVSAGLGGFPNDKAFAMALLIYFVVCGFLVGYLLTRVFVGPAFREADILSVGGKLGALTERVSDISDITEQGQLDARALRIAERQLSLDPDETTPIPPVDLNVALQRASSNMKAQVFYLARRVRADNWQENKATMERSIAIFRALIETDTEGVYHRNHGQLGFALKDKTDPDWAEAASELTKAIEIRERQKDPGWLFYEFNRAVCRMELDQAFKEGRPSDEALKREVLADLKAAAQAPEVKDIITKDPTIGRWLDVNGIPPSDIYPSAGVECR